MSSDNPILDSLNPGQREAARHTTGPLLIVAGAGAGKTKTVTHRIANLIKQGVPADSILAITFTNKAAKELRERISQLLNQLDLDNKYTGLPTASTFHSLGVTLLRQYGSAIGIKSSFTIMDRGDQERLVKEILKDLGYDGQQWTPRKVAGYISNRRLGRAAALQQLEPIIDRYANLKQERVLLDFDDLIWRSKELLEANESVKQVVNNRWTHLHVDEYQDTNSTQYELVRLLAGQYQNVCAVGDTDQTIYTWRGAEIKNLMRFETDFPGTTTVLLEQNYRCSNTIISVANNCISRNKTRIEKNLYTDNPDGEKLELLIGTDERDEARQIARSIAGLKQAGSGAEVAILYRANFQSQALEKALIGENIPYDLLGTKFYARREIKDMLCYLRYGLNPNNPADLERIAGVPKRGIGPKTVAAILQDRITELGPSAQNKALKFKEFIAEISQLIKTAPPAEVMTHVLDKSGWLASLENTTGKDAKTIEEDQGRIENLAELINVASEYDNFEPPLGAQKFLEEAALMAEADTMTDTTESKVRLMTIHASKGLEFDQVYITGLEEGLFPSDRSQSLAEQEEERRLFYVALTRAKRKATLSYATMRNRFGSLTFNSPSEFITEIDPKFLEQTGRGGFGSAGSSATTGLLSDIEF
jgi:DNA helicase-2/ATP-dependent DNA helicase PcrA